MPDDGTDIVYRTSSYSGPANCVQVAELDGARIAVRDSHDPGRSIVVGGSCWAAFLASLRTGGTRIG